MKKLLFVMLLATAAATVSAQKYLDNFYNKYKKYDAITSLAIGQPSLWLSAHFSGDKDANNFLKKISSVQLLIIDGEEIASLPDDVNELNQSLRHDNFDELLTVRDGKDKVKIFAKDDGNIIHDVVVLAGDEEDFVFMHLHGKLSYDDINKLQYSFNDKDKKETASFSYHSN